jgi:superfamily II DNA or RNA helicase
LKSAGEIINNAVKYLNHSVLVLVDEVEQFTKLLPYLQYDSKFAHGTLSENKAKVPKQYWEADISKLVKDFNDGKFWILVGTSCISTGTDIKSARTMIYLKGGKSEIEIRQGVGRCTRLYKEIDKSKCVVVDFDIENIEVVHKHAVERQRIFKDIYPDVGFV